MNGGKSADSLKNALRKFLRPNLPEVAARFDRWLDEGAPGTFVVRAEDFDDGYFDLRAVLVSGPWSRRLRQIGRSLCAWLGSMTPWFGWKVFWFRRAGVRIGRNVSLAPGVVLDLLVPQLIRLDDEVVMGMGSMINAHLYTPKRIFFGRVHVGEYGVVGARAMLGNSVTVEPHGVVGSLSFFYNGVVPENGLALGVPAVIKDRSREDKPSPAR